MVQVNGIREPVQRFSRERTPSVKYSTSCPSRNDFPWAARRAMPTSFGSSDAESRGRDAMGSYIRLLFAYPTSGQPGCQAE